MQEHLIPQDISNYRFHLIGELDLKQFTEIMVGVVIAVVIYQFSLPNLVKFPLMFISAGLGLTAAFIPLGDRPLSHWIFVFFDKLFSPSKFYWKKTTVVPSFFEYKLPDQYQAFLDQPTTFNPTPVKQRRALDYFGTLEKDPRSDSDPLELFTSDRISTITEAATLRAPSTPQKSARTIPTAKPKKLILKPNVSADQTQRARQIITPSQKTLEQFLNNSSIFAPVNVTEQITGIESSRKLSWPTAAPRPTAVAAPRPTAAAAAPSQAAATDRVAAATPANLPPSPANVASPAIEPAPPGRGEVTLPNLFSPDSITPLDSIVLPGVSTPTADIVQPIEQKPGDIVQPSEQSPQSPPAAPAAPRQSAVAELPPLSTAKQFNLAGRITDRNSQPLSDVLISVKDTHGNPKAVIRTNPTGDFYLSQVLDPGNYVLSLQKNSLSFPDALISIDEDGIAPLLLSLA